jgi:uncharacterized protein YyaL (SSP411 family)
LQLVQELTALFLDQDRDSSAGDLPASTVDMSDNATPSGWSLAAEALLIAESLTGQPHAATERLLGQAVQLAGYPQFWGHGLSVLEALLDGPREVAVIAGVDSDLHRMAMAGTRPGAVVALSGPLTADRPRVGGRDTAYVCRGFVCDAPTTAPGVLAEQLRVRGFPTSPASPS